MRRLNEQRCGVAATGERLCSWQRTAAGRTTTCLGDEQTSGFDRNVMMYEQKRKEEEMATDDFPDPHSATAISPANVPDLYPSNQIAVITFSRGHHQHKVEARDNANTRLNHAFSYKNLTQAYVDTSTNAVTTTSLWSALVAPSAR